MLCMTSIRPGRGICRILFLLSTLSYLLNNVCLNNYLRNWANSNVCSNNFWPATSLPIAFSADQICGACRRRWNMRSSFRFFHRNCYTKPTHQTTSILQYCTVPHVCLILRPRFCGSNYNLFGFQSFRIKLSMWFAVRSCKSFWRRNIHIWCACPIF